MIILILNEVMAMMKSFWLSFVPLFVAVDAIGIMPGKSTFYYLIATWYNTISPANDNDVAERIC
jgi:hypothetical protein